MTPFLDKLHRVFTELNNAEVRYLLVGGLAVAAHGHTRATNDIDLFVTEPFDFDLAYGNAIRAELIPGLAVPVVSLDILLAMKKDTGRSQDEEDIRVLRELHPGS